MIVDIFVICGLFILGIMAGQGAVVSGLKLPLKNREFFNVCNECNHKYKWYEMIPIVSFFLNKGECRYCNKELSLWYPFLELLSGLLFSFSYMIFGYSYEMYIMMLLTLLAVVIFVSDFKYYIISDEPLFIMSVLVLGLKLYYFGFRTFIISLSSGLLILVFMLIVRFIGNKMFKHESLGGGDIKLAMVFGFVVAIRLSIVSLVLGSFMAFPYALYSSLSNSQKEIPFGPFLVSGLYVVFLFMEPINSFIRVMFML